MLNKYLAFWYIFNLYSNNMPVSHLIVELTLLEIRYFKTFLVSNNLRKTYRISSFCWLLYSLYTLSKVQKIKELKIMIWHDQFKYVFLWLQHKEVPIFYKENNVAQWKVKTRLSVVCHLTILLRYWLKLSQIHQVIK